MASREGRMLDISCMMIEAEIYGMMLSARIVMRRSAPPENMSNMPMMPPACWLNRVSRATGSIPGRGMKVPRR